MVGNRLSGHGTSRIPCIRWARYVCRGIFSEGFSESTGECVWHTEGNVATALAANSRQFQVAFLLIAASIFFTIQSSWMLAEEIILETPLVLSLVLGPLLEEGCLFTTLLLIYARGVKKSGGIWSTRQKWEPEPQRYEGELIPASPSQPILYGANWGASGWRELDSHALPLRRELDEQNEHRQPTNQGFITELGGTIVARELPAVQQPST